MTLRNQFARRLDLLAWRITAGVCGLLAFSSFAQPVTDLGVMSPNRAIVLEACTNRADFLHFEVELKATRWPSNYHRFVTTNSLLRMDDFAAMPPGPCAVAIKSVCIDGEESPLSLFKLDIRRDPPKAPRAKMVSTGNPPSRNSLTNAFRSRTAMPVQAPSAPFAEVGGGVELGTGQTNNPTGSPLPDGKPETYSDGVIRMQQFYAAHQGRRSE